MCNFGIAQVTNSSFSGIIKDGTTVLQGANVIVIHQPTGSKYGTSSNKDGYYFIPNVRPGGPYIFQISYTGYKSLEIKDVEAPLGKTTTIDVNLSEDVSLLSEVLVVGNSKNGIISKDKTGASQQFSKDQINRTPITGSRTINSITKYNPNGDGSSFGSQDSRLNNFTIDGSIFNNGFGLGSSAQAGGRTGSTAISLDALEQLQVNIAPFDVRQSGFVGAGINAVTRSGTNEIESSVYFSTRNNENLFLGDKASGREVISSNFDENIYGMRVGAPIIKNKLFVFVSAEKVDNVSPGTNWTSTNSPNAGSQVSLPTYTEMTTMSNFLLDKFKYDTGAFENFDFKTLSQKFLVRLDWNINDNNKFSTRFVYHDSSSDNPISNSRSLGVGNRTNNANSMSFRNSGYQLFDNTRSIVLELTSKISDKVSNNFIAGFDYQNEDRGYLGALFPTVDIRNNGANAANYMSIGMDPFTPSNKLDYSTLHFTNNTTVKLNKNTIVFGVNYEKFKSNNMFFPGSHGVYVFNSLNDFYTAANQSLSAGGAPSTLLPARFQLRYSALPGGAEPLQVLKSDKLDFYLQDEIRFNEKFKITAGIRASLISFENTAIENTAVSNLTFLNNRKFNTGLMPKDQWLFEPRVGFNLDVFGNSKTQLRGGFGLFTGRPPFVFVSNQIGNNGVLTGFIDDAGGVAPNYGFTANPAQYHTPATPTLPTTFDLAFTETNYKFPQVFKINLAYDQRLPLGFIGTLEAMFNKNVNEVFYYNANAEGPVGVFGGEDNRPRFARNNNGNRINDNVSMAAVLGNSSRGYHQSLTLKLEYPSKKGLFGSFAYTRSEAKDLMSTGSIASGSWQGGRSVLGNNNLELSYSNFDIPQRIVGLLGYKINYGKDFGGTTTITLGYIGEESGRFSYTYGGDMNGDGISNNDLLYVPTNASQILFEQFTLNGITYSIDQQREAFENYINQDKYLSNKRGQYVDRNSNLLPMLHRIDFSIAQDLFINIKGKRNAFQIRADILNFGNLINSDWGVTQRATNQQLLSFRSTNVNNEPIYRFSTQTVDGVQTLTNNTYQKNSSVFDVWQAQLTLRYTFGK